MFAIFEYLLFVLFYLVVLVFPIHFVLVSCLLDLLNALVLLVWFGLPGCLRWGFAWVLCFFGWGIVGC